MLSRLNLHVTVATLFIVSVCGTGVSHAGQAGGKLCHTERPVLRAGQTVGDQRADLVFTPPIVDGVAGKVNIPSGRGNFRYSLCEGRVLAADEVSQRCTRSNVRETNQGPNLGCIIRGGTQSSFVFAVPPGQTLPDGVSIDSFGILHVHEDARRLRTDIRVCVRQLNAVFDSCQNIGLNQPPAVTPALTRGGNAANVVVPLAVAGGGGIAGYYVLKNYLPSFGSGGSCTPANPSPAAVCFGGNAGGSACQTAISQQDAFCKCSGYGGFNVNTGGCQ